MWCWEIILPLWTCFLICSMGWNFYLPCRRVVGYKSKAIRMEHRVSAPFTLAMIIGGENVSYSLCILNTKNKAGHKSRYSVDICWLKHQTDCRVSIWLLGQQGDQTSPSSMKPTLNTYWKDYCWSWSSNTLATWCKEPTHWERLRCWERLKAGGEGDDRGWDGWMASPTQCTWVWSNSRRRWRTGKPGMLQSMGSQRVRHDWATEQHVCSDRPSKEVPAGSA